MSHLLSASVLPQLFAACALAVGAQAQVWSPHRPYSTPSARGSAAIAFEPLRGVFVCFGGWDGVQSLADTWEYDGIRWTQMTPSSAPPARHGALMCHDPVSQRLVLFGGLDASLAPLGDTWLWNGVVWSLHSQPGQTPSPRFAAAAAFHPPSGSIFLFGGQQASSPLFLQDLWQWNGAAWSLAAASTPVGRRSQVGFAFDPASQRLVLAGGHSDTPARAFFDDTWTFDGATWIQSSGARFGPGRSSHAMAYIASVGRVVLFGGYSGSGSGIRYGDTWELTPSGWQRVSSSSSPSARSACSLASNTRTGSAMLFGGSGFGSLGAFADTWTYGEPNPPTVQATGIGCSWGGDTPALRAASLPWRGERFEVTMTGLPPLPRNLPFLVMGTPVIPPFDLGLLGAPGCLAYLNPYLPLAPAGGINVGGATTWFLPVPLGLAGWGFNLQGIVVEPAANVLGIAVSNAIDCVVR